jgi:hypothetical protein
MHGAYGRNSPVPHPERSRMRSTTPLHDELIR